MPACRTDISTASAFDTAHSAELFEGFILSAEYKLVERVGKKSHRACVDAASASEACGFLFAGCFFFCKSKDT